jgi:signal transduction histidine kinase
MNDAYRLPASPFAHRRADPMTGRCAPRALAAQPPAMPSAGREIAGLRAALAEQTQRAHAARLAGELARALRQGLGELQTLADLQRAALAARRLDGQAGDDGALLESVEATLQRLSGILGELCTLAPQEVRHAARPFDLSVALETALQSTRAELAGVIITRRLRPYRVLGSEMQVTRVLAHLLANAAAAMQGTARARVIHVDAQRTGTRVRVRISDNGTGIDARLRARIFEPFFTTRTDRLGLGLALSRAIVRAHGGTLEGANRRPHGARFAFDLPGADEPLAPRYARAVRIADRLALDTPPNSGAGPGTPDTPDAHETRGGDLERTHP